MRPLHPGALTDVPALAVGHCTDQRRPTGCTVVLCEDGAVAGIDVRGAAPGTRETDLLSPLNTVDRVHAVLLAGGSAFGLDAACGVMRWLDARGVGYAVGATRVPIVPAAILFDLWFGDGTIRPDAACGHAACVAASRSPPEQGSVGAGAGATVGKLFGVERGMRGGIGTASVKVGAVTVGALIAVNAMGDVIDCESREILAGSRGPDGRPRGSAAALLRGEVPALLAAGMATTIGVIGTDARLDKAQATKLAQMGHDGLARVIDPIHTPHDGDTLFALATGACGLPGNLTLLGSVAAHVVARAVMNAVCAARGVPPFPAYRDLHAG